MEVERELNSRSRLCGYVGVGVVKDPLESWVFYMYEICVLAYAHIETMFGVFFFFLFFPTSSWIIVNKKWWNIRFNSEGQLHSTPHLNKKFLSTKSSWDFEGGLDIIKTNWVCPENRFAAKSTGCDAIYYWKSDIPSNMLNLKNNATYATNFLRPSTLLLCKKIIC